MTFKVEIEQEEDGRWIAEVVELPGVLAYGRPPMKRGPRFRLSPPAWLPKTYKSPLSFGSSPHIDSLQPPARRASSRTWSFKSALSTRGG